MPPTAAAACVVGAATTPVAHSELVPGTRAIEVKPSTRVPARVGTACLVHFPALVRWTKRQLNPLANRLVNHTPSCPSEAIPGVKVTGYLKLIWCQDRPSQCSTASVRAPCVPL